MIAIDRQICDEVMHVAKPNASETLEVYHSNNFRGFLATIIH